MDIVGGAYGGADPRAEFRADLESAKGWLEGAMSSWETLTEERRLEMVAASLLSLHRLDMALDQETSALEAARASLADLVKPKGAARPSLVELALNEGDEPIVRVKLNFQDRPLVGETTLRPGPGPDQGAPARATMEALRGLVHEQLHLEDARVLQILDGPFAVVTLRSRARLLVGSAMIEGDLAVAMARATLDAANRFISGTIAEDDRTIELADS